MRDRSADDEHRRSRGDRACGRRDAALIAECGSSGPNAGNDERGFGCELGAEQSDLFGGTDHSELRSSCLLRQLGEAKDLLCGRIGDADSVELGGIHAGENGDGEELGSARNGCCFGCCANHRFASTGVNRQQGSTAVRDRANGSSDGVGNVVELEVEEDLEAAMAQGFEQRIAGGVEEFHADLEPAASAIEAVDEIERRLRGREVERDGEAIKRISGG